MQQNLCGFSLKTMPNPNPKRKPEPYFAFLKRARLVLTALLIAICLTKKNQIPFQDRIDKTLPSISMGKVVKGRPT